MKSFNIKVCFGVIGSFICSVLGGFDEVLQFLFILMIADIITGVTKGVIQKKLSSTAMRNGLLRKMLIILTVIVCIYADKVIITTWGTPITIGDKQFFIRNIAILFYCLEEFISMTENLIDCGVPFPKWLKNMLDNINNTATGNSTPKFIIKILNEFFHIEHKEENGSDKENDDK